ncbi:flagella synthesis protein [Janthinobacterium sp. Marseille]|nr:flagellar protein FlgN [Janthinobacterium sp. Marseille]ABR88357.1 flagella synthesis protein [Janthinobacterium sp. Marseille]
MESFGTSPADSLSEEHKAIRALTQLLQLEQEHLIAADVEGITALTEAKAKAAARMAELANWRHNALAAAGFEPTESSMKLWLESSQSKTARKSWNELVELVEVAKELNRVNGILINKQMVRNQNVLNILQHGTVQGNNVYGPNGQTASKSVGRHIVAG